jgi:NAD(P)H-nitrite reductase large subunit
MKVCDCMDIDYENILEAVKKHGDDIDAIQDETEAGTVCECCLEDDCDKVDLPLHSAIKKALSEI